MSNPYRQDGGGQEHEGDSSIENGPAVWLGGSVGVLHTEA